MGLKATSVYVQVDDYGLKIRAKSGPEKFRLVVRDVPIAFDEEKVLNLFKIEVKIWSNPIFNNQLIRKSRQ